MSKQQTEKKYISESSEKRTGKRGISGLIMMLFFAAQIAIIVVCTAPWEGAELNAYVKDIPVRAISSQKLNSKVLEYFPQYFTVRIWDVDLKKEIIVEPIYLIAFGATYLSPEISEIENLFFSKNFFEHALDEMNWYSDVMNEQKEVLQIYPDKVYYEEEKLADYLDKYLKKYSDKQPVLPISEIVEQIKPSLDSGFMQEITIDIKNI